MAERVTWRFTFPGKDVAGAAKTRGERLQADALRYQQGAEDAAQGGNENQAELYRVAGAQLLEEANTLLAWARALEKEPDKPFTLDVDDVAYFGL